MTTTCPRCGQSYGVGQWYACPHEPIRASRMPDVTWPGGKTFENLGHEPQTFYDKASYQRYLKTHGIQEFVRHQPVPGSDKSPHTTSWAAVSQTTLDGAAEMLARMARDQADRAAARGWVQSMTVEMSDAVEPVTEDPYVA